MVGDLAEETKGGRCMKKGETNEGICGQWKRGLSCRILNLNVNMDV